MHIWGSSLHLPPHRRSSIIVISRDAAAVSHRQGGLVFMLFVLLFAVYAFNSLDTLCSAKTARVG